MTDAFEDWEPILIGDMISFFILTIDDEGRYDTFANVGTSINDLVGERTINQIIPVQFPIRQISVNMPQGSVFQGETRILGYAETGYRLEGWLRRLEQILTDGIENCKDEVERDYLEKCRDKCKDEINEIKKERTLEVCIDALSHVNHILNEIETSMLDISDDTDDDEEDVSGIIKNKVKSLRSRAQDIKDFEALLNKEDYRGYA